MYGGTYNGTNVIALDGTDGKIKGSYYTVGANTVIDASRNITAGTISSGAITAESNGNDQIHLKGTDTNPTAILMDYNGTGSTDRVRIYNNAGGFQFLTENGDEKLSIAKTTGNATFAGTINSGAITSTGDISGATIEGYTFPSFPSVSGYILKSDTSGNLQWTANAISSYVDSGDDRVVTSTGSTGIQGEYGLTYNRTDGLKLQNYDGTGGLTSSATLTLGQSTTNSGISNLILDSQTQGSIQFKDGTTVDASISYNGVGNILSITCGNGITFGSSNLTTTGTISSGAITATAPIKVLQPSSSPINELLVLQADDPNADIIMTDNTGSVRLRTSGNGDFVIFTGGSATSQNASGATTALTINQSQNATFAGNISSGQINATTTADATPAIIATNTGGLSSTIARFVGDSDSLEIRNEASTGDYRISNTGQENGIVLYDGGAGVEVFYNGAVVQSWSSSGGTNLVSGDFYVGGTRVIQSSGNNLVNIGAVTATGQITTDSHVQSGDGSGGVALTINDGYGNANVTWNHLSGVPEQNGNAARIEVNTDATSAATMYFELKSGVTSGVAVQTDSIMLIDDTGLQIAGGKTIRGNGELSLNASDVDFIVADGTDTVQNFIWRDHSASKLYLGTDDAVATLRSALDLNSNNITNAGTISSGAITTSGLLTVGSGAGAIKINESYVKARSSDNANDINLIANINVFDADDVVIGSTSGERFNDNIVFRTNGSQTLRLDSSQNATFAGTISSGALEVNNSSAGATVATFEGNYSASGDVKLAVFERSGGAVASAIEYNDATTDMEFGTTTSHSFSLKTADTRRLTIDSSGNSTFTGTISSGAISATSGVFSSTVNIDGELRLDARTDGGSGDNVLAFKDSGGDYSIRHNVNDGNGNYSISIGYSGFGNGEYAVTGDGVGKILFGGHGRDGAVSINSAPTGTAGNNISFSIGLLVDGSDNTIRVGASANGTGMDTGAGTKVFDASANAFATSYSVGSTTVIDASRNLTNIADVTINGEVGIGVAPATTWKARIQSQYPLQILSNTGVATYELYAQESGIKEFRIFNSAKVVGYNQNLVLDTNSSSYQIELATNGSTKLATTSTGIDVTGTIESTGFISVEGTSGNTGAGTDRWIGGDGTAGTWFYNVPTGSNHYFAVNNSNTLGINSSGIDVTGTISSGAIASSGNIITSSGIIRSPDGSASTPSIQPGVDADTGFFRPTTNNIGFSTAGLEAMRIDANQSLLVGRFSNFSGAKAEIQTSDNVTTLTLNKNNANDGEILRIAKSGTTVGVLVLEQHT
jgi:hypothetical protein